MNLQIGDSASLSKVIGDEQVRQFASLVGDENPVHLSDEYAKSTRFGKRIAHGMWAASLISAVLGMKLPGPGTIYLSQTLQFLGPVYLNDTITATVRIVKLREDKPIVTLETLCHVQDGRLVLKGEAVVLVDEGAQ